MNNADSWLGLKDSHIKTLQNFEDNFIMKVFQVAARGTPKSMLWLDSQNKLRAIAKRMGKSKDNLCRQALIAGQNICNGEELLTKCINISKKTNVKCVSHGKQISKKN